MKNLLNRIIISYHELKLAIKFLFFAIKVVISKRAFLRRLFDVIRRLINTHRITYEIRADLL